MKRVVIVILCIAMSINLCGCGKGKQVEAAEAAIDAIGEVTIESGEAIESARTAYDALKPKQQEKVENIAVLTDAEAVYKAESAIDAIGEVTIDSGDAVEEARNLYAALTPEQQEKVKSADVLTTAEEEFAFAELYEANRITDFQQEPCWQTEDMTVDDLYSDDYVSAFCLLMIYLRSDCPYEEMYFLTVYVATNGNEGELEFYTTYAEGIACIRLNLTSGNMEYGAVKTTLSLDEYVQMLERAGAIREYHQLNEAAFHYALTYIMENKETLFG